RAGHREVGFAGTGWTDAERDVVRLDVLQIRDLVRRAAMQIRAPRAQHRRFAGRAFDGDALRLCAAGELDQAELDIVDGERLLRLSVETLERDRCALGLRSGAAQCERGAAAGDRDVERGLD